MRRRSMKFLKYVAILPLIGLIAAFDGVREESEEPQELNWISFEEAIKRNKTEPRMILVDMYTDWCGWCKRMEKDVYANKEIVSYMNKKYYAVKFNTEKYTNDIEFQGRTWKFVPPPDGGRRGIHHLAYALMGEKANYPTTVILNEKLERLPPIPGYQKAEFMDMVLKYYGDGVYETTPWTEFQKTYKSPFLAAN